MIGAIIGDVVGSRFEFDNYKSKDFEMFLSSIIFSMIAPLSACVGKIKKQYAKSILLAKSEHEKKSNIPFIFAHPNGFRVYIAKITFTTLIDHFTS